jgi:hypothetical protein
MMDERQLYQLRRDVQAHFEQLYGRPLVCDFLEFHELSTGTVVFDVTITKAQTLIGRFSGFTGYRDHQFFLTKLAHPEG